MVYDYNNIKLIGNRDSLICERCNNKKVLHIGATDAPYTKEKLNSGLLLHQRLMKHADTLYGIDINQSAIDYLKTRGINNIYHFDMNMLGNLDFSPDIIVFGEIIEHLQNLRIVISNLKSIMTVDTELIISTPNQLYLLTLLIVCIKHREYLHEDHKTGFTYGSLKQLLESNGLELQDFFFTFLPRNSEKFSKKVIRHICRIRPGISETLLAIAKLKPQRNGD